MSSEDKQPKEGNTPPPRDLRHTGLDEHEAEDRFVLAAEERPRRRWLSSSPSYEPEQFDLNSLPDEADRPDKTVSQKKAAPTQPVPPAQTGSGETHLPLGFVSEPRPVRQPADTPIQTETQPSARLGFISAEEAALGQSEAGHDQATTPPLGYVSEPRPASSQVPARPIAEPPAASQLEAEPEVPVPVPDLPEPDEEIPEVVATSRQTTIADAPASEDIAAVPNDPYRPPPAAPEAELCEEEIEGLTPGEILRQARSLRGLRVEDIVQQTRMNLETVLALEADQPPPQSAWVYVRGFYRRYAKALGIAEAPLLAAHEQLQGDAPETPKVAVEWTPEDVSPERRSPKMLIVVLTGIMLGVASWWLLPVISGYVGELKPAETARSTLASLTSKAAVATEVVTEKGAELYRQVVEKVKASRPVPAESRSRATVAPRPQPAAASPAATASVPSQAAAAPAPKPQAPAADKASLGETAHADDTDAGTVAGTGRTARLNLEFSRQSWTSVTDAQGLLLFEGMVAEGETRQFEGQLPLTLFLGTATAVSVVFDGQPVDVAEHMRPNGTARVILGD